MRYFIVAFSLLLATTAHAAKVSDLATTTPQSTDKIAIGRPGGTTSYAVLVSGLQTYILTGVPATAITQTASYRFVTDTEKATWNAKEPAITAGTTAQYLRGNKTLATMPTTLPASDVYSWAKASVKPSYTASEVGLGNVTNESKATMFTNSTLTGTTTVAAITTSTADGSRYLQAANSSDPTCAAGMAGACWFNTTTNLFKCCNTSLSVITVGP